MPKIVLFFHCLNKLFKWSQNFCKFLTFKLEFQKFFSITRTIYSNCERSEQFLVKFIYSEKAKKFSWGLALVHFQKYWLLSDVNFFFNFRPLDSNFKSFSRSQEQFFLTIDQNNFGNRIPKWAIPGRGHDNSSYNLVSVHSAIDKAYLE